MAEISGYDMGILALTLTCLLTCGGVFLSRDTDKVICAAPTAETVQTTADEMTYPDSLLPGEKIDLNTAAVRDLARLPGIGEKRAQAIEDYRTEHGGFASIDEIVLVYGIGAVTLENLRDYITVS